MIRNRFRIAVAALGAVALAFAVTGYPALAATSFSDLAEAAQQGRPQTGLAVIPLTVTTQRGKHVFQVEVAKTIPEQERGLMFRTSMAPDHGMIFPYDGTPVSFWMHDTILPLDIIFIGTDHRILNIAANAKPYSDTPIPSAGPVSGVLEINGGRAAQLGIKPGDRVTW